MAFTLDLPARWANQRWKVKIRDRERNEPPHVTIMRGTRGWRWGLRDRAFLDQEPDPKDVPPEILRLVEENLERLITVWDAMYPENPVASE